MENLLIGKNLTKTKDGRFAKKAENIEAKTIKQRVDKILANKIKVQVFLKADGSKYINKTFLYLSEIQIKSKAMQLRMINPISI